MQKTTLLFDLDDTLLDSNIEAFVPAYSQAFAAALADVVPPEVMFPAFMGGTRAMTHNTDPSLTLQNVFDAHFFPQIGVERAALETRVDHFYDEVFPTLGSLTRPIPDAIRLMDWAFAEGHRVVIATNPFFPLKATLHRLRWAGLPPEKYPFALVTAYEDFHFTKEKVAYYPEVMAQLGWPEDPLIMVGDDLEREVKPTRAAGFPLYWAHKPGVAAEEQSDVPQGTLADFRDWVEKADPSTLKISFETPEALLAVLRSTPAALATLTAALPDATWSRKPAPGEWCLTEIACHLRDVEREVNLPRFRKLLTEVNPFVVGTETDRWAEERQYAKQDGRQALIEFTAARKESLALLEGLQDEWTRKARHAIFGPTTLQELAGFAAGHDRVHVQQAWKTMKS